MADTKCALLIYTLLLTLFAQQGQNVCVKNDFSGDFEEQFAYCSLQNNPWHTGTYGDSTSVKPPHPNSKNFIFADPGSGRDRGKSSCAISRQRNPIYPGTIFMVRYYSNIVAYSLSIGFIDFYSSKSWISKSIPKRGWNFMQTTYPYSWDSAGLHLQFYVEFYNNPPEGAMVIIDSYLYVSNPDLYKNCRIYGKIKKKTHGEPMNSEEAFEPQKPSSQGGNVSIGPPGNQNYPDGPPDYPHPGFDNE